MKSKRLNKFQKRQHEIGKIFRRLMRQGFDPQICLEEQEIVDKQLGVLVLKYELPTESGWKEVLECLLSKDKYLRLSHYLCENRNDWNDGYDKAEYGLSQFQAESEQDREIVKDVQGCIDNWHGDGKVFRDTKWSYHEIYKLADPSLFKDYAICCDYVS